MAPIEPGDPPTARRSAKFRDPTLPQPHASVFALASLVEIDDPNPVRVMRFPSAIWRFRDRSRQHDGYLFVEADSGRIFPVVYTPADGGDHYFGVGLWFHDFADHEIVTTHIKGFGSNQWLHEYYRIEGTFMQWSNYAADIAHERVTEDEVPDGYKVEWRRLRCKSESFTKPAYDPNSLAPMVSTRDVLGRPGSGRSSMPPASPGNSTRAP